MAIGRDVVIRLRGDIGDFQAKMVAAGKSIGAATDKMTGAEKEAVKFRQGLTGVADTAGKIGLVAAAGLGAIVATTANFEQSMSAVRAATHETASNMDALREAAIRAGADTAFSASEAAAGIENLAKAGVNTKEILGGGLAGALDLAAAGEMEVAAAAEAAAGAMAQFNLDGSQVPHIADLLAAGAGKAQGEVSDMVQALKQSGTVASQTGLTIEETTGTLAAFAEQSLLGSDAGTSFKTMLQRLSAPIGAAAAKMKELDISAYDANGEFIGMSALAGQLRDRMGEMTDETRNATLATIFGSDAVRAASIVYDNGADGIQGWIDATNDSGFAAETASIKLDNLKGDWEALTGSIETALIGAGDGSQGILRSLTQGATSAVNAFNELPPSLQNAASGMLAITAITGGSLWFGAKIVTGIADTRVALQNLGISADKAKGAMKGVAIAGAGLAVLEIGMLAIDKLNESMAEALPSAEKLQARLIDLAGQAPGVSTSIGAEFESLEESIARVADGRWDDKLMSFFDAIPGMGDRRARSLREATAEIEALDSQLADLVFSGHAEVAADAITRLVAGMDPARAGQFRDLLTGYQEALQGVENDATLAGDASSAAAGGFGELGGAAGDAERAVLDLDDAMSALFDGLDVDATVDEWKASLAGLTKELKGGEDALDRNTKRGQENRDAIRGQFEALREMAEAQFEATGNIDQLERTLIRGRQAIIDQAKAAGIGEEAMEAYLKQLGLTPREIRTTIRLMQAEEAVEKIEDVREAALAASGVYDLTFRYLETGQMPARAPRQIARADGGPVYGPGSGTSDSIAAWLSNGEYVIKAAAVAKYGTSMFDSLNAMRYANGGFVRAQATQTSATNNYYNQAEGTSIDYDRLASAMLSARPVYGNVSIQPHNYSEFVRQMDEDQRRAAVGGASF